MTGLEGGEEESFRDGEEVGLRSMGLSGIMMAFGQEPGRKVRTGTDATGMRGPREVEGWRHNSDLTQLASAGARADSGEAGTSQYSRE